MPREDHFLRWIAAAALADWLITRTLARAAIFMPKSPGVLEVYQAVIRTGQFATLLCTLLGLFGVVWLAWRLRGRSRGALSIALASLVFMSLLYAIEPPAGWLMLASPLILSCAVAWLGVDIWKRQARLDQKLAAMVPVLAVLAGSFNHSLQGFYTALRLPGPPAYTTLLFNAGELLAVLSPIAIWWICGRGAAGKRAIPIYLAALLPAVLYLAAHRANPSMTGILAVWSTGLTLYLPVWLYALSLWLGAAVILISASQGSSARQGSQAGLALILLAAAGYAPQLSTQIFLALIALSALAGYWHGELDLPQTARVDSNYSQIHPVGESL